MEAETEVEEMDVLKEVKEEGNGENIRSGVRDEKVSRNGDETVGRKGMWMLAGTVGGRMEEGRNVKERVRIFFHIFFLPLIFSLLSVI